MSPPVHPPTNTQTGSSPNPSVEARFEQIYLEHYRAVLRFVRRRAHPLNVDDIVSETFTAAWVRRASVPSTPLPWLYTTARNVMLNSARGTGRQRALAVRMASFAAAPLDEVDHLERRLDVRAAFSTLRVADQEVLALDVWEDLDTRSAAAVLGCSRASYARRLTRARRRLAVLLEPPRGNPAPLLAPAPPTPPVRPPNSTLQLSRQDPLS
ncbi:MULTISPECIES: RNA polymerase sigma factor [Subtercola]|uniref:Sigma-70 family RNA polymerase sigma factor n=1 Tax=Subtercola vilae TaxID=2056433 RepID=A0A4T2C921_9MICO|nr:MULTISPECIES: sigma-70 family RNA polymerase sigma factor [Subtercola]MEA9983744.1 sigma-70 family RNA polymerase sigma factor [Subtercola sp. RTI3]TIH40710.1 sigma-70 family RNA polymerase sigma factor [Subtercola vilae]